MKSSAVIAMITGFSCGTVIVRNRCHVVAPSTAAASCRSSRIDCRPASNAIVVCGIPAQTPTTITAGSAQVKLESQSMFSPGSPVRRRVSLSTPASRLEEELPHDSDHDRGHRPRNERQRAGEPAAAEILAEEQREAEREDELERRHGDRPDEPDLERVDEEVVAKQLAKVVEPDEGRRDVEPRARIREGQVDAPDERSDAEDDDGQERGDDEEERLSRAELRAGPAAARSLPPGVATVLDASPPRRRERRAADRRRRGAARARAPRSGRAGARRQSGRARPSPGRPT